MGCTSSTATVGGYSVGDSVYYGGPSKTIRSGGQLVFGASGEVVGQTCRGDVTVAFPDSVGRVSVRPLELSRAAPSVPGGYCLGDRVYYGGPARKYPNGDRLIFGAHGEVAGRSCVGDNMDSERLAVMFPTHKDAKAVRLALLSREPPVIPGGYAVGDRVFWCGMNWTFPNGDRLRFGAKGQVAGRSCVGDGNDDERVAVNFPGNKGAVAMRLPEISHDPPVIPGGYRIGDRVFYAYPNWRAPDGHVLFFGVQGKVIGRSCIGDGKDDERVWVLFPGLGYGCICLEQISNEPPVIPGGYNLGDRVFYGGPSRPAGCNGDRLTFGALGEVAGRATSSRSSHSKADVAVVFPGNEDAVDVRLPEVSREAPVLPGNYSLGSVVFYGGADTKYPNGDRLTFGARGEVAGRSCAGDGRDDHRVAVLLPGNRNAVNVSLGELCREPPPLLEERLTRRLDAASGRREGGEEMDVDIVELAIVHQTAVGAGIEAIAELALQRCLAKVELGQREGNVTLLSEVLRAAEDIDWQELKERAQHTLEQVVLPAVLQAAEESGDLFCQLAVEQRARERGLDRLADRAAQLVREADVPEAELMDLRTDRRQLRNTDADSILVQQMQDLLDETYTGWGGFGKRTRTRDRPNEKVADHLEVDSVVQLRNMERYLSYCIRRQVISAELPADFRQDWGVRTKSGELSPAKHGGNLSVSRLLLSPVEPCLNEHYLWHGTGPAEAAGIAGAGFDLEQAGSSRGALFEQTMDPDSPPVQPPQLDDFEGPVDKDLELRVDPSNLSLDGMLAKAPSAKWPASLGTSIDSLKSRWTATKEHYQARKEEVQQAALERGRQIRNATKSAMLDVKEQYQEKRNDLVQKVVNGLEVTEQTQQYRPPEHQVVEVTQRWWTAACAAAHHPHKIADDPPEPPERALAPLEGPATDQVSGTGGTGTDATSHREALGCLEVELLHFSNEPPLTCHDGNVATSPVCQLALGGRCTGALRPRPVGGYALSGSSRQVGASADLTELKQEPSPSALCEQSPPSEEGCRVRQKTDLEREVSSARFLVDEIVGCDLRVHVFDGDSKKFSIGSEDRAFCGGAFVPLSSIVRHHAGLGGPISGLLCQTFEAELAVKLLPLDAVRMVRKLQKAETTGLERPSVTGGLGYVVLRLRLTVYDWVPAWMYTKLPYRGEHAEVHLDGAQVDNPMSVLKAVGKSMERLSRALNPRIFLDAMERLQERAATAVLIHALWAYACLWAPVWKVPGCVVVAVAILAAEVSCVNKEVAESPKLYREELGDDTADLSRMERTKQKVHQAVRMELRMMKFASAVTKVAVVVEKVRYILTLQDPKLSVLILALLCCCLAGATAALRVAAAVFGRQASFVFAWAGGCILLLPARGREVCRQLVQRLIAEKERRLGRGKLKPMALALWRRIPDGQEAQHCELAESYVLRSEGAEG